MKIEIPSNVQFIIDTFYNNGFEAFIVGGCIRDSLLGLTPKDYDIATSALPEETIQLFKKTIPTGLQHGTVTVILENEGFEVTTYRTESTYLNNRCPESVNFVKNIKEDLARRDFTINAFAYNHKEGLLDFFNGQEDLKNKIIRSVGDSNTRFNEDALRMLRAVRFSSQLGFQIESTTFSNIKKNKDLIFNISFERIRDELSKILLSDRPALGLLALLNSGLLLNILPEFKTYINSIEHPLHSTESVFMHNLLVLENTPKYLSVRLSGLFYNMGAVIETILTRLRFNNKTIKEVSILINERASILENTTIANIKKLINRVSIHYINNLFALQEAYIMSLATPNVSLHKLNNIKQITSDIIASNDPLSIKDLKITGDDLIKKLNISPGPKIGLILKTLLDITLENPTLNTHETLLKLAKIL